MEYKWYHKSKYILMTISPVISIISMISLIYFSFIFNYCLLLINPQENYQFDSTTKKEDAHSKGLFLIISVSFLSGMMLINMIKVIFSDPGYFPNPNELEEMIVLKQSIFTNEILNQIKELKKNEDCYSNADYINNKIEFLKAKIDFLNNFSNMVTSGPLYSKESESISDNIIYFLKDSISDIKITHLSYYDNDNDVITIIPNDDQSTTRKTNQIKKMTQEEENIFESFMTLDLTKALLCSTCLRLKIERSHHCRLCGKCVLKMDHHCPWLANCIGFNNYKFFLLIQIYGFFASLIVLLTYWEVIITDYQNLQTTLLKCWFSLFVYLMNIGLFSFLVWLIFVNWKLALTNLTVIENSDKERFPSSRTMNIYDVGLWKNICSVFGNNPFTWLLPISPKIQGNGLVFDNIYKLKIIK